MSFDFNEAREIIEAAKKRGLIREHGAAEPPPRPEPKSEPSGETLPDWLQEGISPSNNSRGESGSVQWKD